MNMVLPCQTLHFIRVLRTYGQRLFHHHMNSFRCTYLHGAQVIINRIKSNHTFGLGLSNHCRQIIIHDTHIKSIPVCQCLRFLFVGFGNTDNLNIGSRLVIVQNTVNMVVRQTIDTNSNGPLLCKRDDRAEK